MEVESSQNITGSFTMTAQIVWDDVDEGQRTTPGRATISLPKS